LVPATGEIVVNGLLVQAREGLVIQDEAKISVIALADTEVVLVVTRSISSPTRVVTNIRESNPPLSKGLTISR
jgi:hypothetical protein